LVKSIVCNICIIYDQFSCSRRFKTSNKIQYSRFSCSRRSHQREKVSGRNVSRHVF